MRMADRVVYELIGSFYEFLPTRTVMRLSQIAFESGAHPVRCSLNVPLQHHSIELILHIRVHVSRSLHEVPIGTRTELIHGDHSLTTSLQSLHVVIDGRIIYFSVIALRFRSECCILIVKLLNL